jgi:hypothetical protein
MTIRAANNGGKQKGSLEMAAFFMPERECLIKHPAQQ